MKQLNIIFYMMFLFLVLTNCVNDRNNNIKNNSDVSNNKYYEELENKVINQTIQSFVDSLQEPIRINLGADFFKFSHYLIRDSLICQSDKISELFVKLGIKTDSIVHIQRTNSKLNQFRKIFKDGKELKFITTMNDYTESTYYNPTNRCLLIFSQVQFNRKCNEGVFNGTLIFHFNVGETYAIYVKFEKQKWILKRIIQSSII